MVKLRAISLNKMLQNNLLKKEKKAIFLRSHTHIPYREEGGFMKAAFPILKENTFLASSLYSIIQLLTIHPLSTLIRGVVQY